MHVSLISRRVYIRKALAGSVVGLALLGISLFAKNGMIFAVSAPFLIFAASSLFSALHAPDDGDIGPGDDAFDE